jgi:hypothetical protein
VAAVVLDQVTPAGVVGLGGHRGHHRPRTMDRLDSQLPAADAALDQGLLDRIDEIVPPPGG